MQLNRTLYRVEINGRDISAAINPVLDKLTVSLSSRGASDSATISIDDTDGSVVLPPDDAKASIYLGYGYVGMVEVFRGKVNDIKSSGGRSGSKMTFTLSGLPAKGKAKTPLTKHYDDKKLSEILSDLGSQAGISVQVASDIGAAVVPFFSVVRESFIHAAERLSRDYGGLFKVFDDRAIVVARNSKQSVSGRSLTPIKIERGRNLISWEIEPLISRPRFKKVSVEHYDRHRARWMREEMATEDKEAQADGHLRMSSGSKEQASGKSKSVANEASRNKGEGSVVIDGDPSAVPEAPASITGARHGVDGAYTIDSVSHTVGRSGFTTTLNLKRPQGAAGKDTR